MNERQYKLENSVVEIERSIASKEEIKKNLIELYDVVNEIAEEQRKKGVDTSDWFYTEQELESIKNNPSYEKL